MRLTWKPKFDCGYSMLFLLPGKSKFDCNKLFYPILGAKDYTRILLFSTTRRAVSCFYKQEQRVVEVYKLYSWSVPLTWEHNSNQDTGGRDTEHSCKQGGSASYPFIFFWQKSYAFHKPSVGKCYLFKNKLPSLELCIPFSCCKCTIFKCE